MISKKLFLTERLILNKISTISSKKEVLLSQKINANMGSYTVQLEYVRRKTPGLGRSKLLVWHMELLY